MTSTIAKEFKGVQTSLRGTQLTRKFNKDRGISLWLLLFIGKQNNHMLIKQQNNLNM